MTLQSSILKLTFDPAGASTVLLAYGDKLVDGPVRFPQRLGKEIVPSADSAYPLILDKLNADFTLKFSIADFTPASPAAAMAAALNALITEAARGVKALKIEVNGISGHYWTVAYCGVTEHEPYEAPMNGRNCLIKGYTLACSGISYT